MLLSRFQLEARGSTVGAEVRGGVTTFLTMAYILFANPAILAAAGVPVAAATAATALAAGVTCLAMGFFANFPLALASGMGLNALVAFQVAGQVGGWKTAMGIIVLEGVIVLGLVATGLRETVLDAIPRDLKRAIAGGIGLFIAFIGLVQARLVVVPAGTVAVLSKDPTAILPPVSFGTLRAPEPLIALAGLLLCAVLVARRVGGAILFGILGATALALATGVAHLPSRLDPPSFATLLQADVRGALRLEYLPLVLSFLMVDFFDTLGTASAVAEQAQLCDARGRIPGARRVLAVDAVGAILGGLAGCSSVTAYIESAAGVAEGARTGLSTIVVGVLFLLCVLVAPLAGVVPACATAPALVIVGLHMFAELARIDFQDPLASIPAFVTIVTLPLTCSIAHCIGYGFATYAVLALATGRVRGVHPVVWGVAATFVAFFALER